MPSSSQRPVAALPRLAEPLDLYLLAGLALWLLLVGYGLRDPWPADEPRFALIGRDIVETGRWFLPHRGPELYAEKPPVYLWLQAAAYGLTGSTRWAFLLPSLLAGLGTLALTFDLCRRVYGRRIALWATLALLLTVQFTLQARSAQIDAVLMLWTTAGLYGLLRHLLLGPSWGWYTLAGVATGLGIITKGTGFLPWLILIPYLFARWQGMRGLAPVDAGWRWALGPLAMLAVIVAWALPLLLLAAEPGNAHIAAYRDDLLLRQTVVRYLDAWHHRNPLWYFIVEVVPVLWLPLSLLGLWAAPTWWRRIRRGDARPLMLLSWVALVIAFFSLSPGKRGVYILPAVPALALALAPLLPGLWQKVSVQRALAVLGLWIGAAVTLAAAWALLGEPGFAVRIAQRSGVSPWHWILGVGVVGLLASLILWRRGALAYTAVMLTIWSGFGLFGYPDMNAARSGSGLMSAAYAALPPGARLGIVGGPEQLLLQAHGDTRSFGYKTPLARQRSLALIWLQQSPDHWLLLQGRDRDPCIDPDLSVDLGWSNRRHWFLIPHTALAAPCAPTAPGAHDGRVSG